MLEERIATVQERCEKTDPWDFSCDLCIVNDVIQWQEASDMLNLSPSKKRVHQLLSKV
jgi:hypothetical protein